MPTIIDDAAGDTTAPDHISPCASGPASLVVDVYAAVPVSDHLKTHSPVHSFTTGPDGGFTITLPPGTYTFAPVSPNAGFPGCNWSQNDIQCPVEVLAGESNLANINVVNAVF